MNIASWCPQFAKLSILDEENYVREDVLFIKCIVDTSKIFHPWWEQLNWIALAIIVKCCMGCFPQFMYSIWIVL